MKLVASISARLAEVQATALQRWGNDWVRLALADYNSEYPNTGSTIVEEDEEDEEDEVRAASLASTASNRDMLVDQGPVAGGDAAPVPASAQVDEQMDTTMPAPSVSRIGITEVSVEPSPEEEPQAGPTATGDLGGLMTDPDLTFSVHPGSYHLQAPAPPLTSSATVESYVMVGTPEDLGSATLVESTAVVIMPAVDEDVAPATDPGAESVTTDPSGGGDAPGGSGGGAGPAAKAIATRVREMGSLPHRPDA